MVIPSGFLLVNKPRGVSSFSCVAHIKRLVPKKTKVGHAGTLDPFAHGLLLIGIGRLATSKMSDLIGLDKVYVAMGKLGERTTTLDKTGLITQIAEMVITRQQLADAIVSIGIGYVQTPPTYSALKHEGIPLYKLARKKLIAADTLDAIVANKSRPVAIHSLEILHFEFPYFTVRAHVSHGTYIRSLIDDIAARAGSCATTYELERTHIGSWKIDKAHVLTDITSAEQLQVCLLPSDVDLSQRCCE